MEGRKVIVVMGATGAQGGSVVRAMKDDHRFHVRAATRNPNSDKAKELVKQGIDVIKVDMDDATSCKQALKGAHGVFLVTNYWELHDENREVQQGKNVADAAKENGVKHMVFSGLKSAKEHIGRDGCEHFDGKKRIHDCIVKLGIPCTTVDLAFYYENLLGFMKPRKNDKNEYVMDLPMGRAPLDMICVSECGEIIHQIFQRPDEFRGKWLALASSRMTIEEYATTLTKVTGRKFVAGTITTDELAKLGFQGAVPLAVMYDFFASGKYDHDIATTRSLNPAIPTFEQWVAKHRAIFEAEFP